MNTTKKLVIAVIALSLALICAVGGTLAFLVAESNSVVNTFTYGNITLTVTETKGEQKENVREFANVIPGSVVEKDPTVTVKGNSEDCYVYVMIIDGLNIPSRERVSFNVNQDWEKINDHSEENLVYTLYKYKSKVEKSSDDQDLIPVFNKVKFDESLNNDDLNALKQKSYTTITIKAFAHQAQNTVEDTADNVANKWFEDQIRYTA